MPSQQSRFPKTISGACIYCQQITVFDVLRIEPAPIQDDDWVVQCYFSKCQNCDVPAVFEQEDFGDDEQLGTLDRRYPPNPRTLNYYVPVPVRAYYDDAVKCEAASAWLACVIMSRSVLEVIVKEFSPDANSIYKGIQRLSQTGVLTSDLTEWATHLRTIGNDVVHSKQTTVLRDDAIETLDFLQAIIELIYDLRPKFDRLKQRRIESMTLKEPSTF